MIPKGPEVLDLGALLRPSIDEGDGALDRKQFIAFEETDISGLMFCPSLVSTARVILQCQALLNAKPFGKPAPPEAHNRKFEEVSASQLQSTRLHLQLRVGRVLHIVKMAS